MTRLAIKGHPTRGKDVIEILEMLGGKNDSGYRCDLAEYVYSINEQGIIDWYNPHPNSPFVIFTLEKFLEKFPYKIGDRVRVPEYESDVRISNMYWDGYDVQYEVVTDEVEWYSAKELYKFFNEPYKEETMEENTDTALAPDLKGEDYSGRRFGYKIPKGYEFECVRNNEIILKPIKPQYPKTYEECCKVLCCKPIVGFAGLDDDEENLYGNFIALKRCRDAYWKIAGEQMGLGKPWKPYNGQGSCKKYVIQTVYDDITCLDTWCQTRNILELPTEEMRDEFYENFKDLIEACKEFL